MPPTYGRRKYADMGDAERAVVDSFEGEASYAKVMSAPSQYIIETAGLLRLSGDSLDNSDHANQ